MKQWYVVETTPSGQTVLGPMGMEQLQELQRAGKFIASTQVCEVGAERWSRADELPELRGLFGGTTPATPWPAAEPGASTSSSAASGAGASAKLPSFGFANAFEVAFEAFRRSWAMLLLCWLLLFAGQMVMQLAALPFQMLTGRFDAQADSFNQDIDLSKLPLIVGAFLLLMLVSILLGVPLQAAQTWIGVRAVRGKLEIEDVVQPFRRYFAVVGAGLLVLLLAGIALIPGVSVLALLIGAASATNVADSPEGLPFLVASILVGALAIGGPVIYLQVRLGLAPVVACDPEQGACGPVEALKRSWAMTRGRFWGMFLFVFCLVLLVIATILLLCIGLFLVGLPLLSAGYGALYELARRDMPSPQ